MGIGKKRSWCDTDNENFDSSDNSDEPQSSLDPKEISDD
jgi:hypothetical protein